MAAPAPTRSGGRERGGLRPGGLLTARGTPPEGGRRDYLQGPILGANSASEANAGHVRQQLLKIAQVEATEMA